MPQIIFDPATNIDIRDALRAHELRLRGIGRPLSEGARELLTTLDRTSHDIGRHRPERVDKGRDDEPMTTADVMTYSEVGAYLSVHPRTVQRLVAAGQLKAVHVGGSPRVLREHLADYLGTIAAEPKAAS